MDNTPQIKLTNTRTRRKEEFVPIDPERVRMYVCGPTVYDRAHIGNARPVVVFDVLFRLLRHVYGADHVTYVRNFTDVDDRIIDRAVATKGADETLEAATRRITDETIEWYHDDMDALGALRPTHEPRCTDDRMMHAMVAMTRDLIAKGHAYEAEGHVLFAVDSWRERYGKLSGRSVDDMIAGARVEVAPYKKNPMDFVLWKPSTDEQPGWQSPWGRGRPGWHIECSAMARELLGEVFDIHAGGIDLQFPHHENEIAQSCCAHDTEVMANFWLHNEMLRVEGEKMSKSLGNFFTVRDLLDQGIPGEVIRFVLLSTHYRQPLDWTAKRVQTAQKTLAKWYDIVGDLDTYADDPWSGAIFTKVQDHLCADLNTPKAFSSLHFFAKRAQEDGGDAAKRRFKSAAMMMGFLERTRSEWLAESGALIQRPELDLALASMIAGLLARRDDAKKARDFARADAIRDGFAAAGVTVTDTPEGAVWELTSDFDPAKLEALK